MNQLPVRSNGAFGRGLAMFAGASALSGRRRAARLGRALRPRAGACAGVDAELRTATGRRDDRVRSVMHQSSVASRPGLLRIGRAEPRRPLGQRRGRRPASATRRSPTGSPAAHRVADDRHLVARLDRVRLPAGANQVGRAGQLDAPQHLLALLVRARSTSIQVCGFCQRNSLTVPTSFTSFVRSNAAGEWCATTGVVNAHAHASAAHASQGPRL